MRPTPALRGAGAALMLALAAGAAAQAPTADRVTFRHLGESDGLSSPKVTAVAQDRLGFIWVATIDGLNRYDGYQVQEYRRSDSDPGSLSSNVVTSLLPARNGAVWVGTSGGGLNRYDPATETFTNYRAGSASATLPGDDVLALAEDGAGRIWVGTGAGLVRLDPEDGTITRLPTAPAQGGLPAGEVMALHFDPAGTLWVGTREGLARLDRGSAAFTVYSDEEPAGRIVSAIRSRESGGLWIGTWGAGLRTFSPRNRTFTPVALSDEIGASVISSLHQDRQGTLWVGTYGGGMFERPARGAPIAHRHRPSDVASLADDAVSSIMEDRQGVLWVGTYAGLDRFDRARGLFRLVRRDVADPASLPGNDVRSILTARGVLWVGTDRGLAQALDSTLTRFRTIPPGPAGVASGIVDALLEDDDGDIWVGTTGGLVRVDRQSGQTTYFDPGGGALESVFVSSLARGPEGSIWVGTNGGLFRLDPGTGRFTPYGTGEPAGRLPGSRVTALRVVGSALWVGTAAGLARLDPGTGRVVTWVNDPDDPTSLCGNEVSVIHARNSLWVGTNGGGLCRLDLGRPEEGFSRFTESASELPSDAVRGIAEDVSGFLWISTSRGLARMDPVTGAFRPFPQTGAGDFNPGAAERGREGNIFVGSSAGMLVLSPGQAGAVNPNAPEVLITAIRLFNEPIGPTEDGPLSAAAPVADEVRFRYDENVVTFEFAAIHYSDPARNTYAYRLDDFDDDWVEVGGQRTATYTSLDPGRYTFRVRATSADGIRSEHEARIRLVVTPPWWRTTWAYLFYILLFGAALSGADRVQRRRVQRQERERAVRAEAELRAVMAETESRALKSEAERLKAEDERKAAELARQEAELQRARENEQKSQEIARAYDALEASVRDLRQTQAQLIQQEKMASLGALTAGIAHEIKNPLNFVNNFAQLSVDLADDLEEELRQRDGEVDGELGDLLADLRENARRIHDHGRRADRIVRNMLDHSRGGAGERSATDVNRFVDEFANLAFHGMRAKESSLNVILQRDLDPDVGQVSIVPQDIGRVLINLLNNAFYVVTERSRRGEEGFVPTVTVSTHRVPPEGRRGERVRVRIGDNGGGVPADVLGRIFEPFFTTKPSGEGTGLGLSMAHEIVTVGHRGTLEVENHPGEGAAFSVTLPAAPAGATRSSGDAPEAA